MCDTFHPLRLTTFARDLDDGRYAYSWYENARGRGHAHAGRGPGGHHLAPVDGRLRAARPTGRTMGLSAASLCQTRGVESEASEKPPRRVRRDGGRRSAGPRDRLRRGPAGGSQSAKRRHGRVGQHRARPLGLVAGRDGAAQAGGPVVRAQVPADPRDAAGARPVPGLDARAVRGAEAAGRVLRRLERGAGLDQAGRAPGPDAVHQAVQVPHEAVLPAPARRPSSRAGRPTASRRTGRRSGCRRTRRCSSGPASGRRRRGRSSRRAAQRLAPTLAGRAQADLPRRRTGPARSRSCTRTAARS